MEAKDAHRNATRDGGPMRLRQFEQSRYRRTRFPLERQLLEPLALFEWRLHPEAGARQNAFP